MKEKKCHICVCQAVCVCVCVCHCVLACVCVCLQNNGCIELPLLLLLVLRAFFTRFCLHFHALPHCRSLPRTPLFVLPSPYLSYCHCYDFLLFVITAKPQPSAKRPHNISWLFAVC